jgi:hypothetical protein
MSTYERIKTAIEKEKQKKIQNESRIEALKEEAQRLMDEVEKSLGKKVASLEELESIVKQMKEEIEQKIEDIKAVLDKEGVPY